MKMAPDIAGIASIKIRNLLKENTAKELEKVLLDAVNGNYWSEHRSPIKGFCKKHIWPLYVAAVDDSYTLSINKELKEIFDPIQK